MMCELWQLKLNLAKQFVHYSQCWLKKDLQELLEVNSHRPHDVNEYKKSYWQHL
jgi:hypothetical protein